MWNINKFLEINQNFTPINGEYTYRETILILICVILFLIALIEFYLLIFLRNSKKDKIEKR